jgi:hypothetical protein
VSNRASGGERTVPELFLLLLQGGKTRGGSGDEIDCGKKLFLRGGWFGLLDKDYPLIFRLLVRRVAGACGVYGGSLRCSIVTGCRERSHGFLWSCRPEFIFDTGGVIGEASRVSGASTNTSFSSS